MVVARSWGRGERENYGLMGTELPLEKRKSSEMDGVDGSQQCGMYLMVVVVVVSSNNKK